MVQAVIFDLDGTLIDSVDLHIQAWKRTFERFGKEVSDEQIRRQIGKGAHDMLPLVFSSNRLTRGWRVHESCSNGARMDREVLQVGRSR